MPEAVIVATARTPIGRAKKGSLVDQRPDDLGALVVRALLQKVPNLDPKLVEDVLFGCAQPAGEQGYNLARVVALLAGLNEAPGATVNRYCSSSLQTIRMAAHAIKAGEGDVFVAGGVECVSRFDKGKSDGMEGTLNPLFNDAMARSKAFASGTPWAAVDGLPDVYTNMLQTAENVAGSLGVTRAEQDEFAVLSQNRAEAAQKSGFFRDEITPVTLANGTVVDTDDCPRAGTTLAAIAGLEPILKKWMGDAATVTAGNACPLNDGAAAVLVMSDKKAKELGLTPLARIVSSGVTGINPEIMGLGPVAASQQALARAGLTIKDIDLVEINEAFAAQVVSNVRALALVAERVNPDGGAIALGHPLGATGTRLVTTLLHGLEADDGELGIAALCVGHGQGVATLIRRLH